MESDYDENLYENIFFKDLRKGFSHVLVDCSSKGWIVCIPRSGSVCCTSLSESDFLTHILKPKVLQSDEFNFETLTKQDIIVRNNIIILKESEMKTTEIRVLFEELFYTTDSLKYQVWCIEFPMVNCVSCDILRQEVCGYNLVHTLQESINFISSNIHDKNYLQCLDLHTAQFVATNSDLGLRTLSEQKDIVYMLFIKCVRLGFAKIEHLKEKDNGRFIDNLQLSIETYVINNIYKHLFRCINMVTAYEDSHLNKIIRNLSDLELVDLGIQKEFYEKMHSAKQTLSKIERFTTVLEKVSCIHQTFKIISRKEKKQKQKLLTVDELLPLLVLLIIRSGIGNWIAQISFMKLYRFSKIENSSKDQNSFLITGVEAALEFIKSGQLFGSTLLESQLTYGTDENISKSTNKALEYLFKEIKLNHEYEVCALLEMCTKANDCEYIFKNNNMIDKSSDKYSTVNMTLCHPLCSCKRCNEINDFAHKEHLPSVHSCDDNGLSPLHIAAMHGRPQILEILLTLNPDINLCDGRGYTALHYSSSKGHQNALLLLLHAGVDLNILNNDENSALHLASNNGHEACVKALLYFAEHSHLNIQINGKNKNGDTALHLASRWGYASIVEILMEYGADPKLENKRKYTPIDYAHNHNLFLILSTKKSMSIFDSDVSNNSILRSTDLNKFETMSKVIKNDKRFDHLLKSIQIGDIKLACFYLGIQPTHDFNLKDENHSTATVCHPLCMCKLCFNEKHIHTEKQSYKQDKVHINATTAEGVTILHVATEYGHSELVQLLLDYGALPNIRNKTGQTALHIACLHQQFQIIKLLLNSGNVNIDAQDNIGDTALHYAIRSANDKIVEIMLAHEPNLQIRNFEGKSATKVAEENMCKPIIKLMKTNQSKVNYEEL